MPDIFDEIEIGRSGPAAGWQKEFAVPGWQDRLTTLSPEEEAQFQEWAKANNAPVTDDYDMRGFWRNGASGGGVNQNDGKLHYPDTYKTPLHESFSGESIYSNPKSGPPKWNEKDQLVAPDGRVLFDEPAAYAARRAQKEGKTPPGGDIFDQVEVPEPKGAWETAKMTGAALAEGFGMLPRQSMATLARVARGGDKVVEEQPGQEPADYLTDEQSARLYAGNGSPERQEIERNASIDKASEQAREYRGRYPEGGAVGAVTGAMTSLPYSVATMVPSVAGQAVGGPLGAGLGMVGSGAIAYRATKDQFLDDIYGKAEKALGRPLKQSEVDDLQGTYNGLAQEYGAWEAIPEAVGNMVFAKLMHAGGKALFGEGGGSLLKRGAKVMGTLLGEQASEQATETITQKGQGSIEAEVGLRDKAPTWSEAFMEQAPTTLALTAITGGLGLAAQGAGKIGGMRRRTVVDAVKEGQTVDLLKGQEVTPEEAQAVYEGRFPKAPFAPSVDNFTDQVTRAQAEAPAGLGMRPQPQQPNVMAPEEADAVYRGRFPAPEPAPFGPVDNFSAQAAEATAQMPRSEQQPARVVSPAEAETVYDSRFPKAPFQPVDTFGDLVTGAAAMSPESLPTEAELRAMNPMRLTKLARGMGLEIPGDAKVGKKAELVQLILDSQQASVPAQTLQADAPTPESQATIDAQAAAVADKASTKNTMIVTPGSPMPTTMPKRAQKIETPMGTVITTSLKAARDIRKSPTIETIGKYVLGFDKGKALDSDRVVRGLDEQGRPVGEILTNAENQAEAERAMAGQAAGGTVDVVAPAQALAERENLRQQEVDNGQVQAEAPAQVGAEGPASGALAENQGYVMTAEERAEAERLRADIEDLDRQLSRINGGSMYTDQVAKSFPLGRVGGSGPNVGRLNRRREADLEKTIANATKSIPIFNKREMAQSRLDDLQSGKAAQDEVKAEKMATAREQADRLAVRQFMEIKPGDMVMVAAAGRELKVVKKNRLSVTTEGMESEPWSISEVAGVKKEKARQILGELEGDRKGGAGKSQDEVVSSPEQGASNGRREEVDAERGVPRPAEAEVQEGGGAAQLSPHDQILTRARLDSGVLDRERAYTVADELVESGQSSRADVLAALDQLSSEFSDGIAAAGHTPADVHDDLADPKKLDPHPLVNLLRRRIDPSSLKRDFPNAFRELSQYFGPSLWKRGGLSIDEAAHRANLSGLLNDASDDALVEKLLDLGRGRKEGRFQRSDANSSGLRAPALRLRLKALASRWQNAPAWQVAQSVDDLPVRLADSFRRAMEDGGDRPAAYYDPRERKAWIVADHVASYEQAATFLVHEAIGHYGLRETLGAKIRPVLVDVYRSYRGDARLQEIADRYALDLERPADRLEAAEELIADLAQTEPKNSLVRRAVAAIRTWLRDLGLNVGWTDADLIRLIERSRRYVEGEQSGGQEGAGRMEEAGAFKRASQPRNTGTSEEDVLAMIGPEKVTLRDRVAALTDNLLAEMNQGLFDKSSRLKWLDEQANGGTMPDARESSYIATRMSTSLADTMLAVLKHGAPVWRDGAVGLKNETQTDQGLFKVFEPVSGDLRRFMGWMVGLRAEKLMSEGRENYFTPDQIKTLVSMKPKDKAEAAKWDKVRAGYIQFKKDVLDFAQASGVIDPEARKIWDHDEYVPFYRIAEELAGEGQAKGPGSKRGIASQSSGIKTLKGGEDRLGDPFENIIRNFTHLVDASIKNHATDMALEKAEAIGVATKADKSFRPVAVSNTAMATALRKVMGDKGAVGSMSQQQREAFTTLFTPAAPSGRNVVHVLRGGKPVYYEVTDNLLLRSLTAMNEQVWGGPAMAVMRGVKRILTRGITIDPGFMVSNLMRDTVHSWVVSQSKFTPFLDSVKGIPGALREDPDMANLMAAGGAFHGGWAYGNDPAAAKLMVERLTKKHGIDASTILDTPKKLLEAWEKLGSAGENAARLQRYRNSLKAGESRLKAAYEAKDVMDFSMRGDWPAVKFLTEVVPFLGARLQGLHKLGRGFSENPQSFAIKGMTVALASTLLYLFNRDDDRFKKLEEWDRDNYFHFWVGDQHYRLPRPFEIGALFGTLPERMVEFFLDRKDGKLLANRLKFMLAQTFAIGPPQLAAPLIDQYANKDSFTGRPIVGPALARLKPGEQRDPHTSATAAELGRMTNISPKRIEHLVSGYFGTLGTYVLGAADVVTRRLADYPSQPSMRLDQMPLIKRFARGSDGPVSTRYMTEMYEIMQEADELYATVNYLRKTGDMARAKEMVQEEKGKLRYHSLLDRGGQALARLNEQARHVTLDRNMSPEDKRAKLDTIADKKNAIAKKVVDKAGGAFK